MNGIDLASREGEYNDVILDLLPFLLPNIIYKEVNTIFYILEFGNTNSKRIDLSL